MSDVNLIKLEKMRKRRGTIDRKLLLSIISTTDDGSEDYATAYSFVHAHYKLIKISLFFLHGGCTKNLGRTQS